MWRGHAVDCGLTPVATIVSGFNNCFTTVGFDGLMILCKGPWNVSSGLKLNVVVMWSSLTCFVYCWRPSGCAKRCWGLVTLCKICLILALCSSSICCRRDGVGSRSWFACFLSLFLAGEGCVGLIGESWSKLS